MLEDLGKDILNVQRRVFDHSHFLSGEIDNFLQNFEQKRNDIEVEKLFKVTETVGELKYDLTDRCASLAASNLPAFSEDLKELLQQTTSFLESTEKEKPTSIVLEKAKSDCAQRKAIFDEEVAHKYRRIDSHFEEKEEEITELYTDLQLKLNIATK